MSLAALAPVGVLPVNHGLDAETSALIARLYLEDLEEAFASRKGKSRADAPLSDEEFAYRLQSQHYMDLVVIAEDEKYAKSLEVALSTDAAHLEAFMVAEEAAAQDRLAAELVSRGEPLPPPTAAQARLEDRDFVMDPEPPQATLSPRASEKQPVTFAYPVDDWSSTVRNHNYTSAEYDHDEALTVCESDPDFDQLYLLDKALQSWKFNARAPGPGPSVNRYKTVNCTVCNESLKPIHALHTPCDHYYCAECTKTLADLFTRDESLFPLRCCQQPIHLPDVVPFLSVQLRGEFERKQAEYSVPSKDRIYCVQSACSTFLGSSETFFGTGVICPRCSHATCPRCKQTDHGHEDCEVNAATIELRALALREGWQTCPGCQAVVELNLGCYHITCRCRTQFCYLCAVEWKNCTCPQWEEARLLATAQQRVENEVGARAFRNMAPEVLEHQVELRAEALRVNHHCDAHQWNYRHGGGTCNQCDDDLPSYLMICGNCSITACRRCTLNRF